MALFILWSGIGVARDTINPLLGMAPDEHLVRAITQELLSHEKVLGVHDLMIHDYGPGRRFASAHVEMDYREDVLDAHECSLQMLYKFHLTLSQLSGLFLGKRTCTLLQHLECGRRVGYIVTVGIHNRGFQQIIIPISLLELLVDNLSKLFQLSIGIACFFTHNYYWLKLHIPSVHPPSGGALRQVKYNRNITMALYYFTDLTILIFTLKVSKSNSLTPSPESVSTISKVLASTWRDM